MDDRVASAQFAIKAVGAARVHGTSGGLPQEVVVDPDKLLSGSTGGREGKVVVSPKNLDHLISSYKDLIQIGNLMHEPTKVANFEKKLEDLAMYKAKEQRQHVNVRGGTGGRGRR